MHCLLNLSAFILIYNFAKNPKALLINKFGMRGRRRARTCGNAESVEDDGQHQQAKLV